MKDDLTSLDNLRPIVEPPPVSWWPMATGWWILLIIMVAVVCVAAIRAWQVWTSNAYRRAALRALQSAGTSVAMTEVLKRAALCAYPRTSVASLSGEAWCQWLADTSELSLPDSVRSWFTEEIYQDDETAYHDQLFDFIGQWILRHHAAANGLQPGLSDPGATASGEAEAGA